MTKKCQNLSRESKSGKLRKKQSQVATSQKCTKIPKLQLRIKIMSKSGQNKKNQQCTNFFDFFFEILFWKKNFWKNFGFFFSKMYKKFSGTNFFHN